MKLVGVEKNDFTTKSGEKITGFNCFFSRPIDTNRGKGVAVERIYVSDARLAANGFDPLANIGKDVAVLYNRYGKVARIAVDG